MAIYRGSGGSTSTTDQATIDQVAEDAATATTKAAEAATSATAAASSASSASSSASSASTSASTATTKASEASSSASTAASSATSAASSATSAASSATSASGSATNAASEAAAALASKGLAVDAQTAAEAAEANAILMNEDAQKSAYGAEDALQTLSDSSTLYSARHYAAKAAASSSGIDASVTAAAASATAAAASETAAASSETAAAGSASAAATSATAAASSATSASGSATTATTKASEAATSATSASGSATTATTKASEASTSATNAATSASTATTKASEAATSATNAAASETAAASSASAAQAAEDAALAALDSFDDRYLGTKSSAPTLDNDGNALVAGALYFNTTTNEMKVYDGSNWLNAYASLSGALLATNNLSDLNNAATARTNLGLGTAATTTSTDYATAAQGALADSALQGNQTITLSGDVSGSGTTAITVTVADDSHNHIISNVDGLQTALDGKVDDSQVLTNVPAGAVFTDTTYSVGNGGLTEINFTSALNSKLAGIESGATADQTASEILTAIKTVDGSGSGLDADTVDGVQPHEFYNNMGNTHTTYTDFNSVGNFGARYVNGGTTGPLGSGGQWYGFTLGLGSEYSVSSYASQMYWGRQSSTSNNPYIYFRDLEGGSWGSWRKGSAGYADSAGNADTLDGLHASDIQEFSSGTAMLFAQTSAPTGWTKSTTHNDKALRVVSGTASSGGSSAFSTAFGTPSVSGTVSLSGAPAAGNLAVSVSGSISNTTLTTSTMPKHRHGAGAQYVNQAMSGDGVNHGWQSSASTTSGWDGASTGNAAIDTTGNSGAHSHGHTLSGTMNGAPSIGNLAASMSSATAAINVQYVDVIIATKN